MTNLFQSKFLLIACSLLAHVAFSQESKLDSLKRLIKLHRNDTIGVISAGELCFEYRFINQDSAIRYGLLAKENASRIRYDRGLAQAASDLGVIYYDKGQFLKARENWDQSLTLRVEEHDSLKMASLHLKIGSLLFKQGKYEESLVHQLTALTIYQNKKFESGVSYALNNIAAVYEHQHQLDKALDYYSQSYRLKEKSGDAYQLGLTQINIANIYFQKKDYRKAKAELLHAIDRLGGIAHAADYLAIAYNNLSDVYSAVKNYDSALVMTGKALALRKSISDYQGIVSSLENLGSILTQVKRYDQATGYLHQALDSAEARSLLFEKEKIYLNLYRLHSQKFESAAALQYYVLYSETKDSLINEASQQNINALQINYETEQKERELSEQKAQLTANALALQESRNRLLWLGVASLSLLIGGVWIYQSQRAGRRKAEFQLQLAEVKTENELQQDRLRISRELHDNIGSRLLFLTSATENLGSSEKAEEVAVFARNTLHELRRTVWLINRDSVSLDELQLKLREYFGFLNNTAGPAITVTAAGDTSIVVRSQKAAAIFRVAQEAVSNAIKHAGASTIGVFLTAMENNAVELRIKDSGKGFDIERRHSGNGLKNMQAHIHGAKGILQIASGQEGTTICATIPLE